MMKVENERQADVNRMHIRQFQERLRILDLERASLTGVIRDLQENLADYYAGQRRDATPEHG